MAVFAALPEHGSTPGHRLLRACPRLPPRGTAWRSVRPHAQSRGEVRPGPAGGRAPVGVAPIATDPRPVSAARVATSPPEGGDVPPPAGVATRARGPQADLLHRRGSALGGRDHPGIPGTIPRRVLARWNPDLAHLPPRVQAAVDRRGPPDHTFSEPADQAPGRRPDAEEGRGRAAGS